MLEATKNNSEIARLNFIKGEYDNLSKIENSKIEKQLDRESRISRINYFKI